MAILDDFTRTYHKIRNYALVAFVAISLLKAWRLSAFVYEIEPVDVEATIEAIEKAIEDKEGRLA